MAEESRGVGGVSGWRGVELSGQRQCCRACSSTDWSPLSPSLFRVLVSFISGLFNFYEDLYFTYLEINPLGNRLCRVGRGVGRLQQGAGASRDVARTSRGPGPGVQGARQAGVRGQRDLWAHRVQVCAPRRP